MASVHCAAPAPCTLIKRTNMAAKEIVMVRAYEEMKKAHYSIYETGHPLMTHSPFHSCTCSLAETARELLTLGRTELPVTKD